MNFNDDFNKYCSGRSRQILGLDKTDPNEFSSEYFGGKNLGHISIDPNANVGGISPNNYLSEIAKPFAKKFFFKKLYEKGQELYGEEFTLKHVYEGTIYIHDATKLQPYCFGLSATEIATLGRPYATLPALPPKRLESFMGQLTEYIMDNSQEFAGAIAVTDLVPWMAWFVEKEEYTDKEIENIFQSFVHVLNNSFRVGGDSPFTNISVNSKTVYYDIFEHYTFPDGKTIDDLWETIKRVQKIIVEFMGKGRPDGLPYRFPLLTANFKADSKEAESHWFRYIAEQNANGFMNINFAERFAMCCRLNLDFDFKQNSFGGGGVKVGSMRVANLNLPRIAYITKEKLANGQGTNLDDTYYETVEYYTKWAMKYLLAYYEVFKELVQIGYLKFFQPPYDWYHTRMFFATVGFCGIWDAAEIVEKIDFNKRLSVIDRTIEILDDMTRNGSNGVKFNVEEVPSEAAAGTMVKFNKDYGERKKYYSNQFIPLQLHIPLHKRIEHESRFQSKLTGGGMTFLNFDAKITPEQSYEIHKYMLDKGFTGQFCINYGYTKCNECYGVEFGLFDVCNCGSTSVQNITRVVGYFAEIHHTAESKTKEVLERKAYKKPVLEPKISVIH